MIELRLTDVADVNNPIVGDIYLANNRAEWITGVAARVQCLRSRLSFFLGEWFLNTLEGVPYYEHILGVKNPNLGLIKAIFRGVIKTTPGYAGVESLDLVETTRGSRAWRLDFVAKLDTGETIDSAEWPPFIVAVPG